MIEIADRKWSRRSARDPPENDPAFRRMIFAALKPLSLFV
jgi:hypothetical protein